MTTLLLRRLHVNGGGNVGGGSKCYLRSHPPPPAPPAAAAARCRRHLRASSSSISNAAKTRIEEEDEELTFERRRESNANATSTTTTTTSRNNASANNSSNGHMVLVDGMSFLFRAFYGFQSRSDATKLINSKGEDVGVLHAYAHAMCALLESKPSHFAVCFDSKGKTFRHEMFVDYKANRPPTPEALIELIPKVSELVEAMAIETVKVSGVEADDLIGTLTRRSVMEKGFKVSIASPDKDFCQLLSENVRMLRPGGGGQFSPFTLREFAKTHEELIQPEQFVDFLALVGDSSDNVPGVEGVGPKTARKLLNRYANVDAILEAAKNGEDGFEKMGTKKMREALKSEKGQKSAQLSRKLVEIRTKLSAPDVNGDLDAFRVTTPDDYGRKALDVFERYELLSAADRWKAIHNIV